jgi:alcohol dehydrogenase
MQIPFSIARLPRIEFGPGRIQRLPALVTQFGRHALLITGARSLRTSTHWPAIQTGLASAGIGWQTETISGEPSPQQVDAIAARYRDSGIDAVIGIGGGSVLDAAKAIAGLLGVDGSVMEYLEGVGPEKPYTGPAKPFIAVPTTAGTGSEATKNAVLSVNGR